MVVNVIAWIVLGGLFVLFVVYALDHVLRLGLLTKRTNGRLKRTPVSDFLENDDWRPWDPTQ
jgi:hypothetical protein